jgi:hypothetical protein
MAEDNKKVSKSIKVKVGQINENLLSKEELASKIKSLSGYLDKVEAKITRYRAQIKEELEISKKDKALLKHGMKLLELDDESLSA